MQFFKLAWLAWLFLPFGLFAGEVDSAIGRLKIEKIADNLDEPWSIAFLPKGFLITERGGRLWCFDDTLERHEVKNIPQSQQGGQAGLFDVLVPEDFEDSSEIFLSYAHTDLRGTALHKAKLNLKTRELEEGRDIFVMNSPSRSDVHFGGRLVEADGSHLNLSLGERGEAALAQISNVDNGAIVRIRKDGSGYTQISKGHRNPQGLAKDENGQLFDTEHGAKGGDEVNEIHPGTNYGWPIISYGVNYDGSKIGEGVEKQGFEQPKFYWDPSIAPSGLAIHSGNNWPEAKGVFFVGSLKFDEIAIVVPGKNFRQIGVIKSDDTLRVRDVREAPDGSLWFLAVNNGGVFRVTPVK